MVDQPLTFSSQTPPTNLVEAIVSDSATYAIYAELLKAQRLKDADETLLSIFVGRLIRGTLKPDEFVPAVMDEYRLDEKDAREIATGVVDKVLSQVEKDLPFGLKELTEDSSIVPTSGLGRDDKEGKVDDNGVEEELAQIKEKKADVIEKKGPLDVSGIVKEICENPAFKFDDPAVRERCAKVVESRVRDVRTAEQTRAQLERSVEQGGVGVSGRRLSDMLALIEGKVAAFQGNLAQEEARRRGERSTSVSSKEELAKKEEALLTKKYIELTGKVPGSHVAPAAPAVSRTSVAISAHHEQMAREGKIDAGKVKEAIQGARASVTRSQARTTASMQDVMFEKRLVGPVDELRSLTLTEFRRLSKDPVQAATKVKDKADLLEEQGYEKKVEAIQAWRTSTLNQMYVALTREALLSGTPVSELLNRKRTAGEETFTDEELKAVMSINAELRF